MDMKHTYTRPYHPQTNVKIENEGWMLENLMLASKFDNSCPKFAQAKRSVKQGWMLG